MLYRPMALDQKLNGVSPVLQCIVLLDDPYDYNSVKEVAWSLVPNRSHDIKMLQNYRLFY